MRISTKRLKRRRLKIIKARKEGATYSELQRRFGVSPNYLSKLFKGKDINKYCKDCGENDPKVLEKHHADKENRPDYTIWLCSNCHSKVSRREARQRAKQKRIKAQSIASQFPIPQKTSYEKSGQFKKELRQAVEVITNQPQSTTHPSQGSVAQPKPIGKAELFHSTLRRWIEAEIWDKKYDNLTGEKKYYVTWEDDGKRSGWVEDTQLRQIFYFGQ